MMVVPFSSAANKITVAPPVLDVYGNSGYFLSPDHPNDYPNDASVTYTAHLSTSGPQTVNIHVDINLQVHPFLPKTCTDYIQIFATKICGTGVATFPFIVNTTEFQVYFYSDSATNGKAFNISYTVVEETTTSTTSTTSVTTLTSTTTSTTSTTSTTVASTLIVESTARYSTTNVDMSTKFAATDGTSAGAAGGGESTIGTSTVDGTSASGVTSVVETTSRLTSAGVSSDVGDVTSAAVTSDSVTSAAVTSDSVSSTGVTSEGVTPAVVTSAGLILRSDGATFADATSNGVTSSGVNAADVTAENVSSVTVVTTTASVTTRDDTSTLDGISTLVSSGGGGSATQNVDTTVGAIVPPDLTAGPESTPNSVGQTTSEVTPQSDLTIVSTTQGFRDVYSPIPNTPVKLSPSQRSCRCTPVPANPNTTQAKAHADQMVQQFVETLSLNKHEVSAERRRHECAPDPRPSAKMMGVVGIVFCSLIFLLMLSVDLCGRRQLPCVRNCRPPTSPAKKRAHTIGFSHNKLH